VAVAWDISTTRLVPSLSIRMGDRGGVESCEQATNSCLTGGIVHSVESSNAADEPDPLLQGCIGD
jgi:hypothetical protein